MSLEEVIGLLILLISGLMMVILTLVSKKKPPVFREMRSFSRLRKAIGLGVEDGSRLHVSLGLGSIPTVQGASTLVGLSALKRISSLTSAGDQPPIASSGDGAITFLAQDTLQASYQRATAGGYYDPTASRLSGLTPFSYVAGTIPIIHDEGVSTNILIGYFGPEASLLLDSAERKNSFTFAASNSLPAQAIFYASAQEPLIGEELFAAGAYLESGAMHSASLRVQDIMRWFFIAIILLSAVFKLLGSL
jgi:hypothetical protein